MNHNKPKNMARTKNRLLWIFLGIPMGILIGLSTACGYLYSQGHLEKLFQASFTVLATRISKHVKILFQPLLLISFTMIEKQSLSDQRIIDCLNTDYGIKVATLTFIPLGADMDASVYKAQTHDQSSYFVKLKRGHHHDIGAIIQLLLHDAGIQQIISPIKTNDGQPTHHIDDFTLIVYPFIEGTRRL